MSHNAPVEEEPSVTPDEQGLSAGQILLIAGVIVGFFAGAALLGAYLLIPEPPPPNLAREAELYVRYRKATPLSEPLDQLLSDPDLYVVPSQPHPLVGKKAPAFTLMNHQDQPFDAVSFIGNQPAVIVFYYGYWCDHCVAQLFALQEDLGRFAELDARVVAISPDTTAVTRERFEDYGAFAFPTLSDVDCTVASEYEVARRDRNGDLKPLHATFVVDSDGVIRWANYGHEPFLGNATLLYELARLHGRLPEPKPDDAP